ncbi:TniB [Pseudomonas coronafaciens pv. coronafaciens]|uniref:TniB family NTP-binding protein n=1 Tax=Pseudomonas coronafaciens TaxID=53409 RepID=UPI000EFF91EE|nr:TniB family NTP-binding protein [Pseudomonas coronafaciens]RMS10957.1 TniB [Pseudomonas coronafaciens pv. coronafaciens]
MEYDHIRSDRRGSVNLDISTRISLMLEDVWVDYSPSESIFHLMNNIADAPRRITAPALLVTGSGGSGKTAIVNQIKFRVKRSDGLLFVNMAADADLLKQKEFRSEIYKSLELPCPPTKDRTRPNGFIPRELSEILKLRNVWGIVIDEIHDLLLCGKVEQRINSSMLKTFLGERYGICLFAFGTLKSSSFISATLETQRRFTEVRLKDWSEDEHFRTFLLGVEELMPLKEPSRLYDRELVSAILTSTGGRMDKVVELIRHAGCYALRSGSERIQAVHLSAASANPWGY